MTSNYIIGNRIEKSEWIYDNKTKERINNMNMTPSDLHRYSGDNLGIWRPDLNQVGSFQFKMRYELAEKFGNRLRQFYDAELKRATISGAAHNPFFFNELSAQFATMGFGTTVHGAPRMPGDWEDALTRVNYITRIEEKLKKYELFVPIRYDSRNARQIKRAEEELTERFFREMQKPPVAVNED